MSLYSLIITCVIGCQATRRVRAPRGGRVLGHPGELRAHGRAAGGMAHLHAAPTPLGRREGRTHQVPVRRVCFFLLVTTRSML